MPLYDADQDRLILRIVYDGPGVAGKTTNVEHLCRDFQQAGELFDGGRIRGRTQYFECMHVDGGKIVGYRLRSVFLTVPGQDELRDRRMALVDQADAIVFVCDSSESGLPRAREMYQDLKQHLAATQRADLPIVVQANKQDLPGALDTSRIRRALGVRSAVSIVPARALTGVGVRETAVAATRDAAIATRQSIERLGRDSIATESGATEHLLDSLRSIPALSMEGEANPLLSAIGDLDRPVPPPSPKRVNTDPLTVSPVYAPPRLPSSDNPARHVWPVLSGPDVIRSAWQGGTPVLRTDRSTGGGLPTACHVFEVGPWCVRTRVSHRFSDKASVRSKLLELTRATQRLGVYSPARCTLCVTEASDAAQWIWTIHPWMRTFAEWLQEAAALHDNQRVESLIGEFSGAALRLLQVALRDGFTLDLRPTTFGRAASRITYLSDEVAGNAGSMTQSLLQSLSECEEEFGESSNYRPSLPPEVAILPGTQLSNLRDALAGVDPTTASVENTQRRWVEMLSP